MNVLIIFLLFFNVLFSNAKASSLKGKAIVCIEESQDYDWTWYYIFKDDRQDHIIPNVTKGNFAYFDIYLGSDKKEADKKECLGGRCKYYLADEKYVFFHYLVEWEDRIERISRKGLKYFYDENGNPNNPKWTEMENATCEVVNPKEAKKILNQKEKEYKSIAEKRKKKNI